MKFVSEKVIDSVIESLDNMSDSNYERRMATFAEAQPVLTAYVFNEENLHLLNEDEKGFVQYLALIIWESVLQVNGQVPAVSEEQIGEAEERNYEILETTQAKDFRERLNPFFENYPQEDLLAFAEEAVLEDEDDPDALVTKEGRELIFITSKTIIDTLCNIKC